MNTRDPERYVPEDIIPGLKEATNLPEEDNFVHWIADHKEEVRRTLCAAPDFIGLSWCAEIGYR